MSRHTLYFALILLVPSMTGFAAAVREADLAGIGELENGRCYWKDFDRDGLLDFYVGGLDMAGALYRNEGDGEFLDVTHLTDPPLDLEVRTALWGDYNIDGYPDLYLVRNGVNLLYENIEGVEFVEVATEAGVADRGNGVSARWIDYDQDGFHDLELVNRDEVALFHNDGDGAFEREPGFPVKRVLDGEGGENGRARLEPTDDEMDYRDAPSTDRSYRKTRWASCRTTGGNNVKRISAGNHDAAVLDIPGGRNGRGWARKVQTSIPAPDGILWIDNTGTGVAIRGQSDYGTGIEAISTDDGLALKVQGTSYFEGNVGIGTSSPSRKLVVSGGDMAIANDGYGIRFYGGGKIYKKYGSGLKLVAHDDLAGIEFLTAGETATNMVVKNGRVGIGTTSPGATLEVNGSILTDNVTGEVSVGYNGGLTSNGYMRFYADTDHTGDDYFVWHDGTGAEVMRIHNDGNVGIGTNQPTRKLHINDVMRLQPRSDYPSNPSVGDICVVGSYGNYHMYCYLNDSWSRLD